jgi:RES domain-containing protein
MIKKISREELKDAPSWIDALITPLNSFMEVTYNALNKNLAFNENIQAFTKELTYITPASYPTMANVTFKNELKNRAIGVQLLQIYDRATYTPVLDAVYIPWILDNENNVVIYPIPGLQASRTYIIRLVVY